MMVLYAWLGMAWAGEIRPVGAGDTVERIASSLGDASLASVIRALNDLDVGEQPEIGRLLELPPPAGTRQVDQRAILVSVVGDVVVTPPGGPAAPAQLHVPLPPDTVVCTQDRSFATIQLASACAGEGQVQDEITLAESTCVELRSMVASDRGRASLVRVLQGSVIVADPPADQAKSSIAVQVADGIAMGVGGFRAHLEAVASGDTLRTEALYNSVSLLGEGEARELAPGEGARVLPEGKLGDTVALLGMGPLLRPEVGEALRRPVFTWSPQPDAFGFQFTIVGNARATRVLYQEPVTDAVHRPGLLFLPVVGIDGLWWLVAPLDEFGFLGLPSPARPFVAPEGVQR